MPKRAEFIDERRNEGRAARSGDRPAHRPEGTEPLPAVQDQAQALWDVTLVATYLRIPVSSVYKMTARRTSLRIPHIRIGGKLRFRRVDVDAWLTLLSTSNLAALSTMRQKASKVTDGDHP